MRMIDIASSTNVLLRLVPELGYVDNEVLISVTYNSAKGTYEHDFDMDLLNRIFIRRLV
jgi:hypothetical protein